MREEESPEGTANARLFVRILPTTDFSHDSIRMEANRKVLYVRCLQDYPRGVCPKNPNYWRFCTDGVFWNACQEEVYDAVTAGLFEELFDGARAVVLCYGQTAAGKTFTSSGLRCRFQDRGLALRILSQLFEEREQRADVANIGLGMSYLEFLGETVRDLVADKPVSNVREVREYPLGNENWAWSQIFAGEARKSFSESAPYEDSNRGHSVLTLYAHSESLVDTDPVVRHSKIHLVDMAGVDSLGSKRSAWKTKSDLGSSNLSKSLMEQLILCVNGTSWKSECHVCPYKSSRFLTYLHDSLNPKCLVRFVAHVHGDESNLPVTLSALKFGARLKAMKPAKLERIEHSSCALRVKNLEREYLRMKSDAELTGMLTDSPDCCNVSQERLQEIRRAAEGFLSGQLENLTLFSLGQAALTLEVFRDLYRRLAAEKEQVVKEAIATATEMLQSQMATEKNSSSGFPVLPAIQKLSRRRSRQQESQISFGNSFRSSDSLQSVNGRASSVAQQAGAADRRGISVGPGKNSAGYEGNVTKALKKLKIRKSESVIIKGVRSVSMKDFGAPAFKNHLGEDDSELPLPAEIPSRTEAWQNFSEENADLARELRASVEVREEAVKAARRTYAGTLVELARTREEMEELKQELENCRHVRHVYERGEAEEEGSPVTGELERNLAEAVAQKEQQTNAAVEKCHVALVDFRSLAEELNEAKKALEESFQDFCKERYRTVFPSDESELKSEETGEETLSERDRRDQARMDLYARLQERLLNSVPKPNKKKWQNLF